LAFEAVNALKTGSDHAFLVEDLRQLIKESRDGLEWVKTIAPGAMTIRSG
jgi:hypothetical protein